MIPYPDAVVAAVALVLIAAVKFVFNVLTSVLVAFKSKAPLTSVASALAFNKLLTSFVNKFQFFCILH